MIHSQEDTGGEVTTQGPWNVRAGSGRVIDTQRQPGSLARAIGLAPRRVNLATMPGPQMARTLMLAQLHVELSCVMPTNMHQKPCSANRRADKIRQGKLTVAKLNGARG